MYISYVCFFKSFSIMFSCMPLTSYALYIVILYGVYTHLYYILTFTHTILVLLLFKLFCSYCYVNQAILDSLCITYHVTDALRTFGVCSDCNLVCGLYISITITFKVMKWYIRTKTIVLHIFTLFSKNG